MKALALLVFGFFALQVFAQVSFMPDNDLWKQDSLYKRGGLTQEMFNRVITIADNIYQPIATENNEKLIINRKWTDSTVNANCSRNRGKVTVNMFGGLARRDEVTVEGFALVLCHELGHAYGGYPYIYAFAKMSAEGQADFYGAEACHSAVMTELLDTAEGPTTDYMFRSCGNDNLCLRGLIGGQSLGKLLSTLSNESEPDYETPDTTVVSKTELSYPSTVQCRLDTYFNGTMKKARPACWFKN